MTEHDDRAGVFTYYFGEYWDVPMLEGATQIDTPTGMPCLYCEEPIAAGEQGLMRAALRETGPEACAAHRECDLRMALGPPQHYEGSPGTCGACGGPEDTRSWREQGRALLAWAAREGGPA